MVQYRFKQNAYWVRCCKNPSLTLTQMNLSTDPASHQVLAHQTTGSKTSDTKMFSRKKKIMKKQQKTTTKKKNKTKKTTTKNKQTKKKQKKKQNKKKTKKKQQQQKKKKKKKKQIKGARPFENSFIVDLEVNFMPEGLFQLNP